MKRLHLLISIIFISLLSIGQTNYTTSRNYRVEKIYLDPTSGSSSPRNISNITYFDGFGRKLQEVGIKASPGGTGDVIIPHVYGVQGRVEREYLPYAKTGNNGAYDQNVFTTSNWNIYGITEAAHAFTLTDYDNSPLDRIVKQTGPGKNWHVNQKGVTTTYGMNEANKVRLYRVLDDGTLALSGNYVAGSLQKVTVADEDGKRVETYTDNMDQTVLVVNVESDNNRLETYSVLDDRGRLRYVLSPEASARVGTTSTRTSEAIRLFGYYYEYDRFSRLILKQLPGCDPVYMVYDKRDRLVMSQDGKQRAENASKWSYSLYDVQNRVVETGEVVLVGTATTHLALQNAASGSDNYVPVGNRTPLQYTLYDNYTATASVPVLAFQATTGYASGYHDLVTGLVTSVKTRMLGASPEKWLTTTSYYDDRCRVIQTVSDNVEGFTSRVDVKYDFVGNVVQQRESHQVSASRTDVLESENSYDDRGRLLSSATKLNGGTPATVGYTYDAVGRLILKKQGNTTETLAYNPRGWLTSKESAAFKMKLRYEGPAGGGVACWNGNISEWEWQQGTSASLMYGFTYDGVNRLKETMQKQKSGTTWSTLPGSYLEKGLTYDRNGNIKTLQRTAAGTTVDNLVYSYTGNQLTGLTENVASTLAGDVYARGNVASGSYTYDKNGNMTTDSRRALNFGYNVLNLLSEVKTTGGVLKAKYLYLADGTKLRVRDGLSESGSNGFDYLGSLTYRKSSAGLQLESASFGEGVIRMTGINGTQQEVNYCLIDHLGSVRVIVDGMGKVLERNDYYPFGARLVRGDYPQQDGNRYKYNGKEEQVTGDLKYLDYGWRMYDNGLGRWFGIDPLSEDYLSQSPYHFCGNNPVSFMDMNGMDYWTTSDPTQIALFFGMLWGRTNQGVAFDYSEWAHFEDQGVLDLLWLNDRSGKIYSSYGTVSYGVATRIGVSLTADMLFKQMAFVSTGTEIMEREMNRQLWLDEMARKSGAIQQDYTIDAMLIPIGKGVGILEKYVGKSMFSIAKTKIVYNSVEHLLENAGKFTRVKGALQGFVKGDAKKVFKNLAHKYKAKVQKRGKEIYFESGDVRVGMHNSVKGGGIPTLHISKNDKLYKIRVTP